jgi:hypothetical protein
MLGVECSVVNDERFLFLTWKHYRMVIFIKFWRSTSPETSMTNYPCFPDTCLKPRFVGIYLDEVHCPNGCLDILHRIVIGSRGMSASGLASLEHFREVIQVNLLETAGDDQSDYSAH